MFSLSTVLILTSFLCLAIIYLYNKWCFTYWKKRKISTPKPNFIFGNSQNPLARKTTAFEHIKNIYDEMKLRKYNYCGLYSFTKPAFLPIHPEYMKYIMSKDFSHFVDRGMYFDEKNDPLSAHLLSLGGEKWKYLRSRLTPTFSTGKIKMMSTALIQCANQMLEAMNELSKNPIDIKEVFACYTTDVIGSCAFGLDCNSFSRVETDFRKYGKKAFETSVQNISRIVFCMTFGNLAKRIGIKLIDPAVSDFFMNIIWNTLEYRRRNNVSRNDFLQLLINLNEKNELSKNEMAAQSFIFFLAGFETSSTTLSSCMYELARNNDIQDKVRQEIIQVLSRNNDKLTYESLVDMKYLQQVIDETLRLYPSVPFVQRICTKEYALPNSDLIIEKGTKIFLPIYALQRDPEYFPDPEKFDPNRFSEESKVKRHPFVYLPFGEGPRICIEHQVNKKHGHGHGHESRSHLAAQRHHQLKHGHHSVRDGGDVWGEPGPICPPCNCDIIWEEVVSENGDSGVGTSTPSPVPPPPPPTPLAVVPSPSPAATSESPAARKRGRLAKNRHGHSARAHHH